MCVRKIDERAHQMAELEAQNIVYRPMVWTCHGRLRKATEVVIRAIAKRIARRRGFTTTQAILRQMRFAFSVCIARRAAKMSLACWPRRCGPGIHGTGL